MAWVRDQYADQLRSMRIRQKLTGRESLETTKPKQTVPPLASPIRDSIFMILVWTQGAFFVLTIQDYLIDGSLWQIGVATFTVMTLVHAARFGYYKAKTINGMNNTMNSMFQIMDAQHDTITTIGMDALHKIKEAKTKKSPD
jgi:hypothetical protein